MYNKKKVINISDSIEQKAKNNVIKNDEKIIKFGGKHLKYLNKSNLKSEAEYFKMKETAPQSKPAENQVGFKNEELKE
jgi:hypothetical protein